MSWTRTVRGTETERRGCHQTRAFCLGGHLQVSRHRQPIKPFAVATVKKNKNSKPRAPSLPLNHGPPTPKSLDGSLLYAEPQVGDMLTYETWQSSMKSLPHPFLWVILVGAYTQHLHKEASHLCTSRLGWARKQTGDGRPPP